MNTLEEYLLIVAEEYEYSERRWTYTDGQG
jgi:hypothetical protein